MSYISQISSHWVCQFAATAYIHSQTHTSLSAHDADVMCFADAEIQNSMKCQIALPHSEEIPHSLRVWTSSTSFRTFKAILLCSTRFFQNIKTSSGRISQKHTFEATTRALLFKPVLPNLPFHFTNFIWFLRFQWLRRLSAIEYGACERKCLNLDSFSS